MAYSFELESEEQEDAKNDDGWEEDRDGKAMLGMVPMADILNADAEFNVHVNHDVHHLEVTTLRPIRSGEEIINSYGPNPNSELLRRYGYVTEKHSQYDVVEIPWEVVDAVLQQQLSASAISEATLVQAKKKLEEDYELEDTYVLEREVGEPNDDGTLPEPPKGANMPEELEERLKDLLKQINKLQPHTIPDRNRHQIYLDSIFDQTLTNLESRYATTIEQDNEMLRSIMPERKRMAITVRLGEKILIQEARQLLKNRRSNGQDDLEPKPSKRMRFSA